MVFQDQEMHRSHGNYPEQRLKLILFLVCVYVYMYASNFATLNNTRFIFLHEYINPMNSTETSQNVEYLKNCPFGVSFLALACIQLVRLWFKSLQNVTPQFLQGNLLLLAVCTYELPFYLCLHLCSRSLVKLNTASYRAFGVRNTSQTVSCNINSGCATLTSLCSIATQDATVGVEFPYYLAI